jgi:hypothetical protein
VTARTHTIVVANVVVRPEVVVVIHRTTCGILVPSLNCRLPCNQERRCTWRSWNR